MIWAVVLAAGESKRMGSPKLLLRFGRKTIIETVIENILSSKVDRTLVVLGSEAKRIQKKIKNYSLKIAVNPHFQKGMLSSVLQALQELPDGTEAMMVFLGDQPSIPAAVTDKIIRAFKQRGKGIILPVYNKDRGHPVLISMKYREEIESLSPDVGLRGLVYSHPEDIHEVSVGSESILHDIDSVEDYRKELLKFKP